MYKLARRNCKEKEVKVSSTDKGILRSFERIIYCRAALALNEQVKRSYI